MRELEVYSSICNVMNHYNCLTIAGTVNEKESTFKASENNYYLLENGKCDDKFMQGNPDQLNVFVSIMI